MKTLIAIALFTMSTISSSAFAELFQKSPFEIPVSERDFRPEQALVSHQEFRVKQVKCQGKDYGILYQNIWGWSLGSKFKGVCEWRHRFDVEKCIEDSEPATIECYNKAIELYKLENKYPKVRVEDYLKKRTREAPSEIPNLDSGSSIGIR